MLRETPSSLATKSRSLVSSKRVKIVVIGVITHTEGVEMGVPGDNVEVDVELITTIAVEDGLCFAICESGRTVGFGTVIANNA